MLDWKFKFKFLFELFAFNFLEKILSVNCGALEKNFKFFIEDGISSMKGNVNVIWSGL